MHSDGSKTLSLTVGPGILTGIPMPPSSNNQYLSVIRNGRPRKVPSAKLSLFKKEMMHWALVHRAAVKSARELIGDAPVEIEAYFYFPKTKLIAKTGNWKKLDVSNRLKALHDCLSDILHIDDKLFVACYAEKIIGREETVTVRVTPTQIREVLS